MAEASSSKLKHDVFLSFSGETRQGFTNHLYHFLQKIKGIATFIDNQLPRGQQIEPSLTTTIENSRIAVVIFSKKYASSSWCLDELVKIKESNLITIPIFYKVEPEHVLNQSGKFGDEFTKLKRSHAELEITKWISVLASAATLSGFVLANYSTEIDLVEDVAAHILKTLYSIASPPLIPPHLVGIDSLVDHLHKLLTNELSSVQFLGIYGMGGIGKTTIAEVLYHQLSRQFDTCDFVTVDLDVPINIVVTLRNKIISKILGEDFSEQTPNQLSTDVLLRLQKKKVFIVFDNVSNNDQVTTLVGTKANPWFARGSKVIFTSRDSSVFKNEGIEVFEMKGVNKHYALNLFCLHAFKQSQPPDDGDFVELSNKMVKYTKGVPLALKVLGSELFRRPKDQWRSTLEDLRRSLKRGIRQVLEISYKSLEEKEKKIFIDIACFFKGHDKNRLQYILDGCGFSASIGIARLIEKCLVTITVSRHSENEIGMHDLIQQMGWEIAEEQSQANLGKHVRIWKFADSRELLTSYQEVRTSKEKAKAFKEAVKVIEGIFLNMDEDDDAVEQLNLHPMVFSKMQNLRVLKFYKTHSYFRSPRRKDWFIQRICRRTILFLPNSLRFLQWDGYPYPYLPSDFSGENLVELTLRGSILKRLWKRAEDSINLKGLNILNLKGSKYLTTLPDLTSVVNLKEMILDGCTNLLEIPPSIQYLHSLYILSLKMCVRLRTLPTLVNIRSLRKLRLRGCICLTRFPETSREIEEINLRDTTVVEWPNSMSGLNNLKVLNLPFSLQELPRTLHLSSLKNLYFNYSQIQILSEIKGGIRLLHLPGTKIRELPSSITLLCSLVELNLAKCYELQSLPNNFDQLNLLETLQLRSCRNLRSLPVELPHHLHYLDVSKCALLELESSSFIKDVGLRKLREGEDVHQFCFGGCVGLSEDACKSIVKNTMMRIKHMANNKDEDSRSYLTVNLPGNEIPEYFQSYEGSSITVELSDNWVNTMFKGFIFSVVVNNDWNVSFRCIFRNMNGSYLSSYSGEFGCRQYGSKSELTTLCLHYSPSIEMLQSCRENYKDAAHATVKFSSSVPNLILKCGIHLVYADNC